MRATRGTDRRPRSDKLIGLEGRHVVVLGGAGFLGAHLCRRLVANGAGVTAVDNFLTSRPATIHELRHTRGVTLVEADITQEIPVSGSADFVLNFASPASPVDYVRLPLETLRVGSIGTENALRFARSTGATFMTASTSEIYGDPNVSPQPESYWGYVNPIGPRSMYDESKRYAEALTMAYHQMYDVDVRLPRIFNTYGPGMRSNDGRAIPSFITAAVSGEALQVHGDGLQTRSLCHVDDLVDGLLALLVSGFNRPVNIGNPEEITMVELAGTIVRMARSSSEIVHVPRTGDDPQQRRPDITLARELLGFAPSISLSEGLSQTVEWFRNHELVKSEHITISLRELERSDVGEAAAFD
jgi:dTDP-glucose 4,6-dehydratase